MQFKNLYFNDHPVVPDAIMAQATLDNGKRISVVAGVGLYSTSKAGNRKRANIHDRADDLGLRVLNRRNVNRKGDLQ